MQRIACFLALCAFLAVSAFGQDCPVTDKNGVSADSAPRTLEGQLVYHDGIRHWFELKLDKPQCGQASIELVRIKGGRQALEVLRGCRVGSTGKIYDSPTGYYSLDLAQDVISIEPKGDCKRQPAFPDYSKAKPDPAVRSYRVEMLVDSTSGDHPIQFHVTSSGRELQPWQAYASYWLTGGFVLYGKCADGFIVDDVTGPPSASPGHFTKRGEPGDMAMYDPESAADAGVRQQRLGYTCIKTLH